MTKNDNNHIYNEVGSCEAELYAKNHPLVRPKINWLLIGIYVFSLETIIICLSFLLYTNLVVAVFLGNMIAFFLHVKYIAKLVVKIHQRYAPTHVRRRCKCKPSCSEYALLVLKKYNVLSALVKINRRVRFTCRGDFKIDTP